MALFPRPHTDEWFDAMEAFDPMKAMQTRQMVKLAGSDEVCGVCGDDPASDYQLKNAALPANAVATLRLCDDCLGIRRASGEAFVPLP